VVASRIKVYRDKWRGDEGAIRWGSWEVVDLSVDLLRVTLLLLLVALYLGLIVLPTPARAPAGSEETTGLLNGRAGGYGAIPDHKDGEHSENEDGPGWARKTTVGKQSWWEYLRGYTIFFPYLWPAKERRLQILMMLCFGLVILQRGVNVLVPDQLGKVTDILSGEDGERKCKLFLFLLFVAVTPRAGVEIGDGKLVGRVGDNWLCGSFYFIVLLLTLTCSKHTLGPDFLVHRIPFPAREYGPSRSHEKRSVDSGWSVLLSGPINFGV
jgi:hypothetical protein